MGLAELLGINIDVKDIEKHALAAEQKQAEMLVELKKVNEKLAIIAYAAERVVEYLKKTK
jgi:hypothetical protein